MGDCPNVANMLQAEECQSVERAPNRLREVLESKGVAAVLGEKGVDLLMGLLRYEPNARLTASKALEHPYFLERFPHREGLL